jgi:isochorismate synthase
VRALLQSVRNQWQAAAHDPLLVLTARCPLRSRNGVAALHAAALAGERLHFAPVACNQQSEFSVAGRGETARLTGDGQDAAWTIRSAADSLLSGLHELRAEGCEAAPRPRLYGGFRFVCDRDSASAGGSDPWRSFADASFTLPRWLLLSRGDDSFLQLAIRASALHDPSQLESELAAIEVALSDERPQPRTTPFPPKVRRQELPAEQYVALVKSALQGIAAGDFVKVVTACRSQLTSDQPFELVQILGVLDISYSDCKRFAIEREGAVFVGATPELLVARRGRKVFTEALAGTKARTIDSDDEQLRTALLHDDKERREHAHVITAIVDSLHACGVETPEVFATKVRSLRNVHHLGTPIAGVLREGRHVLDLVRALHPTPAVCGLPREAASEFLATHEPTPRGLYAAPVGWFDAEGDGEFWVAIRSALLRDRQAWLYAGAGIVAGSDPHKEYEETAVKLRAMLGALGVSA